MDLGEKLNKLPTDIKYLLEAVTACAESTDLRVYLVGGMVRDLILGREDYDLDIVVEGDAHFFAQKLSDQLKVTFRKHKAFGTATVFSEPVKIDIATAREEVYAHDGALPQIKPSSLRDDLKRRDFAMNALALSLNSDDFGNLIDFFGACNDIKKGIVRILHDQSFMDDPTRILRGIRFKSRFGFKFDKLTKKCMSVAIANDALSLVNEQRIREELKYILQENDVLPALKLLYKITGFSFFKSSIARQRPDFSFIKKAKKAILSLDNKFAHLKSIDNWIVYLMVLFHKVPRHELEHILSRFAYRRVDKSRIHSVAYCLIEKITKSNVDSEIYKILEPLSFEAIIFFYAKARKHEVKNKIVYYFAELNHIELEIKGRDLKELGIKPSVHYNTILERVLHHKLDKKNITKEHELEKARQVNEELLKRKEEGKHE